MVWNHTFTLTFTPIHDFLKFFLHHSTFVLSRIKCKSRQLGNSEIQNPDIRNLWSDFSRYKDNSLEAKNRHLLQMLSKFSVESFVHPQTINNWDDLNLAWPYSIREEDHHGRGRRAINSSLPFLSLPCFHLSSCTSGDGSTVRGQASWNVRLWNCRCGEYFFSVFLFFFSVFLFFFWVFLFFLWVFLLTVEYFSFLLIISLFLCLHLLVDCW